MDRSSGRVTINGQRERPDAYPTAGAEHRALFFRSPRLSMEAPDAARPPRRDGLEVSQALLFALLNDDQVGVSHVQRSTVLGELHFHHIFLPRDCGEASKELEDVVGCVFASRVSCTRSTLYDLTVFQDR